VSQSMNEMERLSYLQAMGIDSYVPRLTLPGALPSVLCEVEEFGEVAMQEAVPGRDALKQLVSQPVVAQKPLAAPQRNTAAPAAIQTATQVSVRFHWVIFQPTPAVLLLLPSAHADQEGLQLLKKILVAINIADQLTPLENFIWPPVSSAPSTVSKPVNSLDDAKKTLHALLEHYQLKQRHTKIAIDHVLVFDENLGKSLFEGVNILNMQIRILPSLQLMLNSAPEKITELKQATWQRLKDLKK
jgi:hypothetical protein